MIAGYVKRELNSKKGFRGIAKKICYLVFVAMAHGVSELTGQLYIRDAVITDICANEALSIIENASKIGVPVPDVLLKGIEMWKKCSINRDGDCK
jgi:toxin secretion/phage lysis holin